MRGVLGTVATLALVSGCSAPPELPAPLQPEAASGWSYKPGWHTKTYAVATAHPLAADAGAEMLRRGGSAIDAAVAAQMVLGLVEPQASGIGGGAFLLYHDGKTTEAYDGRETAPAAVDEKLFLNPDGTAMPFMQAVVGGRSVGVPGAVRMLEMAHQRHGLLHWAELFGPAITLAERGFPMGARLAALVAGDAYIARDPVARRYFFWPDGTPHRAGDLLRNPAYAAVLRKIAAEGSRGLLEGAVAAAIVASVRGHSSEAGNPGSMQLSDLADYRARVRQPLCHDYAPRGRPLLVCGMPPPSSGAIAIGQILGMLSRAGGDAARPGAQWLHLYAEASRLAFADRALYVADPDFVDPPAGDWQSLLAPSYLDQRASLLGPRRAESVSPGRPHASLPGYAAMAEQPELGTSHLSIVDAHGQALAMTTTIESQFGSRLMVNPTPELEGGFLLNNELTDFSFLPRGTAPGEEGKPVANRVQPGKRPRSSMSPTLVFDKSTDRLLLTGGSAGGAFIIHSTAKLLHGVLASGLDVQRAADLPNFGVLSADGKPLVLERSRFAPGTIDALRALGHEVREADLTSGVHAVERNASGWFGAADPRREGAVRGD